MSAAAAGGSDDDGGGGRKPEIPPAQFFYDEDIEEGENAPAVTRKKLPVMRKPITKKRPLVPFTWGKMSSELVMRASLERQYRRPELRPWATAAPPPSDDDGSSDITQDSSMPMKIKTKRIQRNEDS